jgi:GTPase SAR1 family protein
MVDAKCVVAGDTAVDKTCLCRDYVGNVLPTEYRPTVFGVGTVRTTHRGKVVACWDSGDEGDPDNMRILSCINVDAFLLCFRLICPDSLQNVAQFGLLELLLPSQLHPDGAEI